MSYIEEMTYLINHYKNEMGTNPHIIAIGQQAYNALVKEIEDTVKLYQDNSYKDHEGLSFMGVKIEVCDE